MRNRSFLGLCATVVLVSMLLFMPQVRAEDDDRGDERRPDVLSNAQVQAATGKSIAYWGAKWWQWAFDHPEVLGDTTGEFGHLGNVGGPVFFAIGSGGDPVRASYKVPGGQYILLPVATYIWTFFDPCAEINCARKIVDRNFIGGISYVDVRIDGQRVQNMRAHLVKVGESPLVFKVDAGPTIQPDGYGGILDAVQGGYWVMLEPLSRGTHQISMFTTVPNLDPITGEIVSGSTDLDAKLKLSVNRREK
jgi:hypothetical protein